MANATVSGWWWLVAVLALALLVSVGKRVPNDGRVTDGDRRLAAAVSVSPRALGQLDASLGADESIVSMESVAIRRGDDGATYVVDAMVYDRARQRQRLERLTARVAADGAVTLTERTPVVPLPSSSDESITFAPLLAPRAASMAYPLERPGTYEYAAARSAAPETWDFSVLDQVEAPPMSTPYDSLATERSSFKLQYG